MGCPLLEPVNNTEMENRPTNENLFAKATSAIGELRNRVLYPALVLKKVMNADSTSQLDKLLVLVALGYLLSPIDVLSDFIPIAGMLDDLGLLLIGVQTVARNVTPAIEGEAKAELARMTGQAPE